MLRVKATLLAYLLAGGVVYAQVLERQLDCDPHSCRVILSQPIIPSITDRLLVPPATHIPPAPGEFHLVLWQPNPNSDNGELVPTKWPAGEKTGFFPAPPVITKQLAFDNKAGSSTAQMDGGTVGAYLNSRDLPASTHKQKMMITPVYRFRKNEAPKPFYSSRSTIVTSLDLQVPTAIDGHNPGSNTYVDAEFLFSDSSGALISYGVTLFHNAAANGRVTYKFDSDTKSFMITSPLGEDERYVHIGNGSSRRMSVPWSGWHRYQFDITRDAFAAALRDLNAHYPGALKSVDPTEYSLLEFHLNAELHFSSGPAELGWSMRNLKMLVN